VEKEREIWGERNRNMGRKKEKDVEKERERKRAKDWCTTTAAGLRISGHK
jgi:hypothetical protein